MRLLSLLCMVLSMLALNACASKDKDAKPPAEKTAEELYEGALKALNDDLFKTATQQFEEVERQHPYSELATKAQLMSALSSYYDERYDDAVIALDRFIQLHPGNQQIDYAYYLKALSYYDQITDIRRDQHMTMQALDALNILVQRFPKSEYRREAELKRDLVLDHLAGKEMEIGRYYLNRNHINAAINRFQNVIKEYQTTTHVPEALHRLIECYMTLGLKGEAQRIAVVLGHNYPGSPWYERTYKLMDDKMRAKMLDNRSAIDRTIDSIFKPE